MKQNEPEFFAKTILPPPAPYPRQCRKNTVAAMKELVFEVPQEAGAGRRYVAESLGESIITQGDTWEELCANVKDTVGA